MTEIYDRDKIIDCMFDPITSLILAELESGEKKSSFLAKKCAISEYEIHHNLAYLIKYDFIIEKLMVDEKFYLANGEKLNSFVENSNNFDAAIDGLTKLDSYLN